MRGGECGDSGCYCLEGPIKMSGDMREVFIRLREKGTRFLDESKRELQYYPDWKFKQAYLLFHEGPVGLHHALEGG